MRIAKNLSLALGLMLSTALPMTAHAEATIEGSPLAGKKIVVSMQYDWEPLAFLDSENKPTGYFHDILIESAKRLGAEVEITSGDFAAVIPAIQSGKFDTAVGVDATVARQEVVDIVAHSSAGYRLLLLKSKGLAEDATLADICGYTIALLASHPSQGTLEKASADCEAAGQAPLKLDFYPDRAANFLAVKSGRADATPGFTGENGWLLQKDADLTAAGPIFDTTLAGFPLQKGSALVPYWQAALNQIIADGTYKAILDKYSVGDVAIGEALINPAK